LGITSSGYIPVVRPKWPLRTLSKESRIMIILGVLLAVLGYVLAVPILQTVGIILVVAGAVLWILGAVGRPVAGRKVWF
jgi:hypothetical protein